MRNLSNVIHDEILDQMRRTRGSAPISPRRSEIKRRIYRVVHAAIRQRETTARAGVALQTVLADSIPADVLELGPVCAEVRCLIAEYVSWRRVARTRDQDVPSEQNNLCLHRHRV